MITAVLRNIAGLRGRYVGFGIVIAVLVAAGSAGLIIAQNVPGIYQQQLDASMSGRTIVVQAPLGSGLVLDDPALARLRAIPGVARVEETFALSGDLTLGDDANPLQTSILPLRSTVVPPLAAGSPELGPRDALIPEIIDGRPMDGALGTEITILRNVALRPGETVSRRETLHVVGLVERYWQVEARNPVYVAPALAREWLGDATGLGPGSVPADGFTAAGVLVAAGASPDDVLARVQSAGFQASTAAQIGGEVPESLQDIVALSAAIRYAGIVIGLIVAFVFVRTMLLSRLPEVGLLKSFGHPTSWIVTALGSELLAVALVAAAVGVTGGAAAAYAVATGVSGDTLPPGSALAVAIPSVGLAAAVVAGTCVAVAVAAAIPLLGAARQPALVALRTRK